MKSIKERTRKQYPKINHVEPEAVAAWLKGNEKVVLVDTRERAEFDVSHLKGAIHLSPKSSNAELKEAMANLPGDAKVVLYCSVGLRSAHRTEQFADAGVKHVYNMNGSIFQWANEGRPLYQNENETEKKVEKVHPYNKKWGKLLKPELRADVKPADGS